MGSFLLQVNDYGTGGFHLNLAVVTINGIQIIAMPHCIIIKESQTYCINLASTVLLFFYQLRQNNPRLADCFDAFLFAFREVRKTMPQHI